LIYGDNINGKDIKLVGYRSSDNKKPSEGVGNVENYDTSRNIILYKINTEAGDSGSPVLVV
jgi:V8-like Glu-specific endopeptidase